MGPFNSSGATRAVALDTSKAFDRVWHAGLLHRLKSYGMSGIFDLIIYILLYIFKYLMDIWSFLLFSVKDSFEWFWMESLHKNIQLMLEFLKVPFLTLHFSCYTLMAFLMMLSVILLSMLLILLSILSVIRYLICGNNFNWLLNLNLIYETLDWGKKWLVDFNAWKTQVLSFEQSNNNGSIDMKMDGSVLEQRSSFKMLGLTFTKLDLGFYIISIAETASKKIGALIHSMKFFSPEVALYL